MENNKPFNLDDSLKNAIKQVIKDEHENDKLFIEMEKILKNKKNNNGN